MFFATNDNKSLYAESRSKLHFNRKTSIRAIDKTTWWIKVGSFKEFPVKPITIRKIFGSSVSSYPTQNLRLLALAFLKAALKRSNIIYLLKKQQCFISRRRRNCLRIGNQPCSFLSKNFPYTRRVRA